jgi:PAS domain S-box-containing protein
VDNAREKWLMAAGAAVVILFLVVNVQLTFSNTRQLYEQNEWVVHTHKVMDSLNGVLSMMKDAETGQRGYLLTGDPRFLEPYDQAIATVHEQMQKLEALMADNARQQARLPQLRERVERKLAFLAGNIEVRRTQGIDASRRVIANNLGRIEMDALRATVGVMLQEEQDLLDRRAEEHVRTYWWALLTGLLSGAAALILVAAFIVLLQRHLNQSARAAAALYEQRELLRITLASIGDAIITTDTGGRVTYLNAVAETLTGWGSAQAAGQPLPDVFRIVNEETRQEVDNPALRALREGVTVGLANHTVLIARDGSERPIDDSAAPIRDEAGTVVGSVLVFRDVADRRSAEERLRSSEEQLRQRVDELAEGDRRKDEFLATLAHELRNPLAPLSNALGILRTAADQPQVFGRTREMMERQLGQMVRLIDDLLDVSRISKGKIELRLERIELAAVIHQAIEICRPLSEKAAHRLDIDLPAQPIMIDADNVRLAQVFCNLLGNAFKFTPPKGHILLGARVDGGEVHVSIRDNGIGIAPDRLGDIFELFTQLDRSLERTHGGLGIGLTLVQRLLALHGGAVEARSEGPGKGAEFIVRLPLSADQSPATREGARTAMQDPKARKRILVADDNQDSANSLSILLRLGGHEVETVHDGLQAVEAAARSRPDAILLDIGMPGLNGYEAARRIREQPWGATLQLIALTGWGAADDRRKSQEAGFDVHLVKPVNYEELVRVLAGTPAT